MTEQKVVHYFRWDSISDIKKDMNKHGESGWRVHTCLNKDSDILVVYEREVVK